MTKMLVNLPIELQWIVLSLLPNASIAQLRAVCHNVKHIIDRNLCLRYHEDRLKFNYNKLDRKARIKYVMHNFASIVSPQNFAIVYNPDDYQITLLEILNKQCTKQSKMFSLRIHCEKLILQKELQIDTFTALHTLCLKNLTLDSINQMVFPKSLHTLDLSWTSITSFSNINLLLKLKNLNVSWTPICSLEDLDVATLHTLNLRGSKIMSLKGARLPDSLRYLDIASTRIGFLNDDMFPSFLYVLNDPKLRKMIRTKCVIKHYSETRSKMCERR